MTKFRIWYEHSGVFRTVQTLNEAVTFISQQNPLEFEHYEVREYRGRKRVGTYNHLGETI